VERGAVTETLATIDLEPLDLGELRDWRVSEALETFRGKVNRISVGMPRWRRADETAYRPQLDAAAAMSVDLTLLPDTDCRFSNAELSLHLEPDPGAEQAVVASLDPTELSDEAVVVREVGGALKASLGATLSPIVEAEAGRSASVRDEVARILVRLAGFGTGTPEAGWRLTLTDAREIPLNTSGLTAVIAHPGEWCGTVWFSVVARLEVRSRADRWLTAAFGMRGDGRLECSQPFPPPEWRSAR
jgi:hypothetical protein